LAQRYNIDNTNLNWYQYTTYNYDDTRVKTTMDNIWSDAYELILNINRFIEGLKVTRGILTEEREKLLKGEAFSLRAMLHFDILRLFGPASNKSSTTLSIPYYKEISDETQDLLPVNKVIEEIINDLQKAEQLLANDPII